MKLKVLLFVCLLFSMCILLGCFEQAENNLPNEEDLVIDFENAEIDKAIEDFTRKYNAIDFSYESEDMFSVDIIDTYKEKNLFLEIHSIYDVFYIEDDMYIYLEPMYDDDYHLLLKITPEQYEKIKTFNKVTTPNDYLAFWGSTLYAVFYIDNIEIGFSALDAYFSFGFDRYDMSDIDYDIKDTYKTRIMQGTLLDIIEIVTQREKP